MTSILRPSLFAPEARAAGLRSGRIAAFLMDSDDERLAAPDCPLRGLPTLRITPRLAPRTQESHLRGSWYLADRLHETLAMSEEQRQRGLLGADSVPMRHA